MPVPRPGAALVYRPRPHRNQLQEIVEEHLESLSPLWDERFRNDHGPLHPRLRKLFEIFTRCGNPHFGFLRLRCPECGFERLVPHSCKVLWLLRMPSGDWRIVTDRLYLAEDLALQAAREWKAKNSRVEEQREPA